MSTEWELAAAGDDEEETPAPAPAPAAAPPKKPKLSIRRLRTNLRQNHLGVPLSSSDSRKIKYQNCFTVVYDVGTQAVKDRDDARRVWRLLQDTRSVIDASIRGLHHLFRCFREAALEKDLELAQIGRRAFREGFVQYGVRGAYKATDEVLINRLFDEFCEREEGVPLRIDTRHFIHQLVTINHEPIEVRLDLLFDVWDLDDSRTLKHKELADHVTHGLPMHKRSVAMEAFNRAWIEVRRHAASKDREGTTKRLLERHPKEITKPMLLDAAKKLVTVANFFDDFLTRVPPKADDHKAPLRVRMGEIDRQVRREVLNEPRITVNLLEPATPFSKSKSAPALLVNNDEKKADKKVGDQLASLRAADAKARDLLKPPKPEPVFLARPAPPGMKVDPDAPTVLRGRRDSRANHKGVLGHGYGSKAQHQFHTFVAGSEFLHHVPPRSPAALLQKKAWRKGGKDDSDSDDSDTPVLGRHTKEMMKNRSQTARNLALEAAGGQPRRRSGPAPTPTSTTPLPKSALKRRSSAGGSVKFSV